MNERVRKAIEALLDDEARPHRRIAYERTDRLIEERGLSPEESLALHERLSQLGIAIAFDEDEDKTDAGDAFDPAGESMEDQAGSRNLLRIYLSDIGAYPLLAPEEEGELARKIAEARRAERALTEGRLATTPHVVETIQNGIAAKRRMVLANMRLVLFIARKYQHGSDLDLLDLMQDGAAGLMRAAEKFDPDRGFRFSTYAVWWVREAINRAIVDRGSLVRFPARLADQIRRLRRAERRLRAESSGREPTLVELAQTLEWDPEKTSFIRELAGPTVVSLGAEVPGADELILGDTLEAETPGPEELYARIELTAILEEAIDALSPREKTIITHRFGLAERGEESTLEEIGARFGLSRERIRQIEERALGKLRERLEGLGLRTFL